MLISRSPVLERITIQLLTLVELIDSPRELELSTIDEKRQSKYLDPLSNACQGRDHRIGRAFLFYFASQKGGSGNRFNRNFVGGAHLTCVLFCPFFLSFCSAWFDSWQVGWRLEDFPKLLRPPKALLWTKASGRFHLFLPGQKANGQFVMWNQ